MTLGCKVNKYESDSLVYELLLKGYEVTDVLEVADIYVINTCAVTGEAEKKSRQMIARCRKYNKNSKIIICGCASQKNQQQFREKNVDYITGVAYKMKIIDVIDELKNSITLCAENEKIFNLPDVYENNMIAKQTRIRAYIKIQDGCNNFCSYCIIPYLRGRSRSRVLNEIINEVEKLDKGIQEIVITGINVTDYKIDNKPGLETLLEKLDKFNKRIRLSSMEESIVEESFIKKLSTLKNFCPHFHLSLQSGSSSVLKRMNRHYNSEQFSNSINLIRKYFPLAGITTDVIVGFPEESDEEFLQTLHFVENVKFSQLHIFQYSSREGTIASKIYKDLDPVVKQRRFLVLDDLNKKLKKEFILKNKEGCVLIEEKNQDFLVGYTKNYIKCYIKGDDNLIGTVVNVSIIEPFKDGALAKVNI